MKCIVSGKKRSWLFLAFLFPCVGMLLVMLVSGYEPFGKYSMLYSDMYHQYFPFFTAYRRALLSGQSLLYSWNVGMGMDYLGLISYYLASPLYLLSIFVPEGWLLEFFSLLMPVKLGLAGLFFAVLLKKLYGKDDVPTALFGAFYGLCAWALGYQWNIMWLDTFAVLPLVILGEVALLRERKFVLYTLTLFLSVFANYYIGFFTCIFVALVFFCFEICRFPGWKRFLGDLGMIAFFSALAIGMTAILELPALAALQTTQSSVNNFPTGFRLNIASDNTIRGLLDAMRQVAGNMGGSLEPTFKEGLPNLYCGVGSVLLGFVFLMSPEVKLRDKLCAVTLLVFFNLSFIIRQLDYIWHGFHFTNMIPYRFSFLHSFVLLYMAYRGWLLRRKREPLQIVIAMFLAAAVLCCSNDLFTTHMAEAFGLHLDLPVYLLYNGFFLLCFGGTLIWGCRRVYVPELPPQVVAPETAEGTGEQLPLLRETVPIAIPEEPDREAELREARIRRAGFRRQGRRAFTVLLCVELASTLVSFGVWFPGTGVSNYPKGKEHAASMVRYLHEREEDNLFYRTETTHSQTLNDGALNNYNGVSTFTSSANVRVTEFMKALGYGAKNTYNRYCFEESSPVSNLFLGLKYMLERDGRDRTSDYFREVHHYGDVSLLENTAYLPLGFLAEAELETVDFTSDYGAFQFQNQLFSAATGIAEEVWSRVSGENLTITGEGVTVTEQNSSGYCAYSDCESGSSVTYSYVAHRDGFLCIHLNLPKRNDFEVSVNGEQLYRETISLPQMLAVKDVKAGDVVEIRISCDAGEKSTMTVAAAILDRERFLKGYDVLSAATLELTKFKNTRVEGTIRCDREGLLYTSIPQNGDWEAAVDGQPAEIHLIGDCMIALKMTPGEHSVTFTYHNDAFSLGWKVSLGCAVVFGVLALIHYRTDWKKRIPGKFQKNKGNTA